MSEMQKRQKKRFALTLTVPSSWAKRRQRASVYSAHLALSHSLTVFTASSPLFRRPCSLPCLIKREKMRWSAYAAAWITLGLCAESKAAIKSVSGLRSVGAALRAASSCSMFCRAASLLFDLVFTRLAVPEMDILVERSKM
jgi:hypothetical protein